MTRQEVVNIAVSIVEEMRKDWVPRDTGNMADNSLKYKIKGNYMVIYFDSKVAPYVPYTNEPWISDKWHGKKNPNEGWWDRFAEEFTNRLTGKLGGKIL